MSVPKICLLWGRGTFRAPLQGEASGSDRQVSCQASLCRPGLNCLLLLPVAVNVLARVCVENTALPTRVHVDWRCVSSRESLGVSQHRDDTL